jgi:hypothetical protein
MTALILWGIRLLIIYVIVMIILSQFSKKKMFYNRKNKEKKFDERFNDKGKDIEDANFKEIK